MKQRDWIEYCHIMQFDPSEEQTLTNAANSSTYTSPPSPQQAPEALEALKAMALQSTNCQFSSHPDENWAGEGSSSAELVFIEPPSSAHSSESRSLLYKMIQAMGLSPSSVYISTLLQRVSLKNKEWTPTESTACRNLLQQQIQNISPTAVVALGSEAKNIFLGAQTAPNDFVELKEIKNKANKSVQIISTHAPSDLIRNPQLKRSVWENLQKVMKLLNLRR